jgi:hypothetical protein
MIWTGYPILYSQIDEILHDLDEFFLFSSNSKTQTLFDHFVVFYKKNSSFRQKYLSKFAGKYV